MNKEMVKKVALAIFGMLFMAFVIYVDEPSQHVSAQEYQKINSPERNLIFSSTNSLSHPVAYVTEYPDKCSVCGRTLVSKSGASIASYLVSIPDNDAMKELAPEVCGKSYAICVVCYLRGLGIKIPGNSTTLDTMKVSH